MRWRFTVPAGPPLCVGLRVPRRRISIGGSNASAHPPSRSRFAPSYGCGFVGPGSRGSVSPPAPSAAPWVTHGPFPPPRLSCPRHPRYYGPIRQTRAHGPTSPSRLYGPPCRSRTLPVGPEPFPALRRVPCHRAAARTPQGSPGALARLFPGDASLRRLVPGSAPCVFPTPTSAGVPVTTRQHSLDAAAR